MADVTQILSQIEQGDPSATDKLLPLVYDELRKLAAAKMAAEKPGQTLQATALVHEAFCRLVGSESGKEWEGRSHFFAAAAEAMRRILVEQARRKAGPAAGGGRRRVPLADFTPSDCEPRVDLVALNDAIDELESVDQRAAQLVKLRFFGGLSRSEAAEVLGVSLRTADNDWVYAKVWLSSELGES